MAALTHAHVSLETYLDSTYEPDAEYADGMVEERLMGESDHVSWQEAILECLRSHAEQ